MNETKYVYMQQVLPGLYLGSATASHRVSSKDLYHAGISEVIDVGGTNSSKKDRCPCVKYRFIPLQDNDSEDVTVCFRRCFNIMNKRLNPKNKQILIHCKHGISRSVSIVLAYLIHMGSFSSVDSALQYLQKEELSVTLYLNLSVKFISGASSI